MSVATQIERIETASKLLRRILGPTTGVPGEAESQKFSNTITYSDGSQYEWGPWALDDGTGKIDDLVDIIKDLPYYGTKDFSVYEGSSAQLPRGFYEGGTITGLTDSTGEAEKYKTQTKTYTPTKSATTIKPDTGYYALSAVTVNAIPAAYQDVSATTATAATVLSGYKFTNSSGAVVTGTIADKSNAGVQVTNADPDGHTYTNNNTTMVSVTIPDGYYHNTAAAYINIQAKSVTPTKATQVIYPDTNYWLGKVTVNPIPTNYITTTDATATATTILSGYTAYVNGSKITGTMTNFAASASTLGDICPTLSQTAIDTAFGESDSYGELATTLRAGYYNPSNRVAIPIERKSIAPTKSAQDVYPTNGYLLGRVYVQPIPDAYQDVTGVTATAAQVLSGSKFVTSSGTLTTGTMTNRGAVTATLNTSTTSYTIPAGYHNGSGKVSITTEIKSVTPTTSAQTITPSTGNVISKVTVAAIPSNYITTTDATATAAYILSGYTAYVNGSKITGTMKNNGSTGVQILNATPSSISYTSDKAQLTATLSGFYNASAAYVQIQAKSVTPTKSAQTLYPDTNYLLGKVTINAIPAAYQDVSATTATAATVLSGYKFTNTAGTVVTGTMANNGAISKTFDPLLQTEVLIPAGYTTGGAVKLTSALGTRLAAI